MAFSFNISIDLTDNSPVFQAAMEQGVRKAAKMIGMQAERNVKALTPVDSGRLRGSITHESDSNTAYIGTNVKYAPYVEFGHHQTPGRYVPAIGKRLKASWVPPQPYLKPGIMDHIDEYEQIAHDAIESCMP